MKIPEYIVDGKNLCEETIKDMSDDGNKIMTKEKVPAFVISRYEKECHRLSAPHNQLGYMYYPYGIFSRFASANLQTTPTTLLEWS